MTYLAWGAMYEGNTDALYYDVLIPRVLEQIAYTCVNVPTIPDSPAVRLKRGSVDDVANDACEAQTAFHILFIHADTGGRGLEAGIDNRGDRYRVAINDLCGFPLERCIVLAPRHETEAWLLADPNAVLAAMGYTGDPEELGLPPDARAAERLLDPKELLSQTIGRIRGRRRPTSSGQLYPAIAQRQNFELLRQSESFQSFEREVRAALYTLGCY